MGWSVLSMSLFRCLCLFCGLLALCGSLLLAAPAAAAWLPDGTPMCVLAGDQSGTRIISDGSQGAIVVWIDYRHGNADIYAQRVDGNGNPIWTPEGVPICTAAGSTSSPIIASDEAGGAVIAWDDYRNGNHDIYAQRITADGQVLWAENGIAVCTAAGYQFATSIISAGGGGVIVAWEDSRGGAYYDIYAQRINGANGASLWAADGRQICGAANSQYSPQAVSDGALGAIITWYDFRNGNYDVYAQRVNLAGTPQWTNDGVVVSAESNHQSGPMVATDGAGGAIIVWEDYRSGSNWDIYAQRLTSAGTASWTAGGVQVCSAAGNQNESQILSDASGSAIIAWTDYRGANSDIYSQRVNSAGTVQWTANGVVVCGAIDSQARPELASDGSGGAIITWDDSRPGDNSDIYAQKVISNGAMSWVQNGIAICSARDYQWYPAIVFDGFGGAIIAWEDYRSGTSTDVFAGHVDGDGNAGWTSCGVPIAVAQNNQGTIAAISDAGQGAIIVWEDYRAGNTNPGIYAQRVFSDGYRLWSKNGVAVSTAASYQTYPSAAPDGSGGLLAAWQDLRNGNYDVYAQRVSPIQAMLWRPDGAVVCSTTAGTYFPQIAPDGSGGAIVVWENLVPAGTSDIYAQRLNSSGSQTWAAAGVSVCSAANHQQEPQIISDGASGGIVAWTDLRGATVDVYAQRVDANGTPLWTPNGVVVSGAASAQNYPRVVPDGAGGAVICWKDSRSGNYDIYAQRLNSVGAAQWTANGVVVCAEAGQQQLPALLSDGAGGVIVCWEDYRSGSADIYAQRLNSSGQAQWAGGGRIVCAAADAQSGPSIVTDGNSGAIISWQDRRGGVTSDVYAQRLEPDGDVMWGTDGVAICASDLDDTRPAVVPSMPGQAIVAWTSYSTTTANDVYALSTDYIIAVHEDLVPPPVGARLAELDQNFPNPFNPVTKIAFTLREATCARLCVYDIAGRVVRVLEEGVREAGRHEVVWDGRDSSGTVVASGVYFYGLELPGLAGIVESKKMVIVR